MKRFQIHPIADETCSSLLVSKRLAECNTYDWAKYLARINAKSKYGAGILDTQTGEIDVGFGLGVPCPDIEN